MLIPLRSTIIVLAAAALSLGAATARAQGPAVAAPNGCVSCHAALTDTRLATPAKLFSGTDVHRDKGFACVNCHGGDPAAGDAARAHDVKSGFTGRPVGEAIITTCARCHSDADLMRRFAPKERVDQAAEYATSVHGKQLAKGDTKVATCISCHGAHGIRQVTDAESPVFPTNVARTCAACHADPTHMAGYTAADGSALPTNQFADYQKSVHFAALTRDNDLSAPTCNDCHGNHGAVPPGVGSIANVCGTCHAVFAQKFQASVHSQIFDQGCVQCHANHAVLKPSDEMLGSGAGTICATCHSGSDDKGAAGADRMRGDIDRLKDAIAQAGALTARVKNAGIEVSDDELALREARTKLTLARTEMHTSDPAQVDPVITTGMEIVAHVDEDGRKGVAELQFRRRGLAVSFGAMLVFAIALALKVRQIDRRTASRATHQ